MVEFKLTINDPKTGKSYKKVISRSETDIFRGKKIGDTLKDSFGLKGYGLIITGGSDKQGFPMRKDLDIAGRKRLVMTSGPGVKIKRKGMKKIKTVVGRILTSEISQINLKVSKPGTKSIEELLGIKKEEKQEKPGKEEKVEAKQETKTEEKKEEIKPEKAENKEEQKK